MDWKTTNFDWNRARAFLVTAEEGSFSAAAKALEVSQSTLGRQVASLEEELKITLFQRVGKGIEITPGGLQLLEHVRKMGDAANDLSMAATGQASSLHGTVIISASEAFSVFILPPILKKIRESEPGIKIEIVATNQSSDLRRREADIALRNFRPKQADLIAAKAKDTKAFLYATKAYIKEHGPFTKKSHLKKADFIGFPNNRAYLEGLSQLGLDLDESNFPIISENHIAHWSLVKNGMGIGVMTEQVGEQEADVEKILKNTIVFPVETWVVAHRELKTSHRIRFVFDSLLEGLNGNG